MPEQGQGAEGGRSLEVSLSVGRSVGCLHGVQAWSFVQRQNSIATGTGAERLRERTRKASEDEGQMALQHSRENSEAISPGGKVRNREERVNREREKFGQEGKEEEETKD